MTTIDQDIDALEAKIKQLPNSLHRNKMTSHLSDVRAHNAALILGDVRAGGPPIRPEPTAAPNACTCPGDGVTNKLCPQHGDVPAI